MFNNELWNKPAGGAGGAGFYSHQIANSFRWTDGAAYLKRTPSSAGNRQTWTFSCWMKASGVEKNTSNDVQILNAGSSGNQDTRFRMYFYNSQLYSSSNEANYNTSPGVYRDPSAWYHVVWKLTGGTSYQYVNGTLASSVSVSGNVAINNNVEHVLGISYNASTSNKFKGYFAEVVFIDGTALDPTSFAESKNGVWIPSDPSTLTFGSQGYYLDFADASAPGNDVSGNNNDWTNVSLATHDQMLDSPTFGSEGSANFPTANVLDPTLTAGVVTNGNLQLNEVASNFGARANFAVPLTGKWYWEAYVNNGAYQETWAGITGPTTNSSGDGRGGSSNATTYGASWSNYSSSNMYIRKYIAGVESAVSGSFGPTSDTILGVAINRDDNEAKFYKNNVLQFTTTISATQEFFPAGGGGGGTDAGTIGVWNFGQDGTFAGNETAQGNADGNGYGDFYYAPPTDFLALCAANLPTAAAVDPAQTDDDYPQKLFSPILYTGNGTGDGNPATKTITGLGFKPDYVNIKERANANTNPLYDSSRGNTKLLTSTATQAEIDQSALPGLVSFDTDGFKAQYPNTADYYVNRQNKTYVAWCQRANGGSLTTNNVGTQTSYVQTDPSGAFSITKYVGTGSAMTVGHGLSVTPEITIIKDRDTVVSWPVYTKLIDGSMDYFFFDTDSASNTSGLTGPNSSVWTWQSASGLSNTASKNYIMYNFANIEGYCKVGTYVGNAATDGTFVYTGFKPSFMMNKPIVQGNWRVVDSARSPYNVTQSVLSPNSDAAEDTSASVNIDLLSNGFKMRNSGTPMNQATTFVYLAFAENPFQYATAR